MLKIRSHPVSSRISGRVEYPSGSSCVQHYSIIPYISSSSHTDEEERKISLAVTSVIVTAREHKVYRMAGPSLSAAILKE